MGIIWGLRYLKQQDVASKKVGVIAMTLSILAILFAAKIIDEYIHFRIKSGKSNPRHAGIVVI